MKKRRPKRLNRTNSRLMLIGGASLSALVFCAAVLPHQPAPTPPPVLAPEDDSVIIPTPSRPIARGEQLSNVQWTYLKWPKSRIGNEYLTSIQDYQKAVAISPLPQMLPVPRAALSFNGVEANAVVEGIPQGMRAITVKVDIESSVEGWARSGNTVDVIVIRASKDSADGLEAKVIAENVKILSAGRSTEAQASGSTAPSAPSTVTLLVNQEDSLKIKTASNFGKLTFALRGTDDSLPATSVAMNQRAMLGGKKREASRARNFRGYARGPDGKLYVLDDHSRWLRSEDAELTPAFVSMSAGGAQ